MTCLLTSMPKCRNETAFNKVRGQHCILRFLQLETYTSVPTNFQKSKPALLSTKAGGYVALISRIINFVTTSFRIQCWEMQSPQRDKRMGGASKHNQKGGLHMLSLYYLTDLVLDANAIQFMNLFVSS